MLTGDGKVVKSPELVVFCEALRTSIPEGEKRSETARKWKEQYCVGTHEGREITTVIAGFIINGNIDTRSGSSVGPKWLGAQLAVDLQVKVPEEFEYKNPTTGSPRETTQQSPTQPAPSKSTDEPAAVEEPPRELTAAESTAVVPINSTAPSEGGEVAATDIETRFAPLNTLIRLGISLEDMNQAAIDVLAGKGLSPIPSGVDYEIRRNILETRLLLITLLKKQAATGSTSLVTKSSAQDEQAHMRIMESLYHYLQRVAAKIAEDIEPLVSFTKTFEISAYIIEAYERDIKARTNWNWWANSLTRYGMANINVRHDIAQQEIFPKLKEVFPDQFDKRNH